MHSTETINQFLNLRAQGWTLSRIANHLHVSKPTLIQWSHKHQSKLETRKANQDLSAQAAAQASDKLRLEHLVLFHTTLRQELIKRTLQNLSDDEVEALAADIQHRIEKLTGPAAESAFDEGGPTSPTCLTRPTQSSSVKASPAQSS